MTAAKDLHEKYKESNRYTNFGPVIRRIRIDGFRGINGLELTPEYPVLALSGLNGSGKSTVGQLMACAYRAPTTAIGYKRFYVKDFFPSSVLDPSPFYANAKVSYSYQTTQQSTTQDVTVSRVNTEWSGYKRQPERSCYYVGFTLYLPKVERRDLSVYRAATLELRSLRHVSNEVAGWVSQILNQPYSEIHFQSVGHGLRESELGVATKFGNTYSENHMGFGEGRALYMVSLMESVPEQSLFILEEPETSLHEEAQFRLSRYLLEVCNRRHHQIILSTHSTAMLEALPSEARAFLYRTEAGVDVYPGITSTRARAILSGGYRRALTVAVEDEFAALVLEAIIRKVDPPLLRSIKIVPLGSGEAVKNGVTLVRKLGFKAIAVRDADMPNAPNQGLFTLPGALAPELEVFNNAAVRALIDHDFGVNVAAYLVANPVDDHHELPEAIAKAAETSKDNLSCCAIREYVNSLGAPLYSGLVDSIRCNA